jgi:hypothetical protein
LEVVRVDGRTVRIVATAVGGAGGAAMLNFSWTVRIWLATAPVDSCRSFDRLAGECASNYTTTLCLSAGLQA